MGVSITEARQCKEKEKEFIEENMGLVYYIIKRMGYSYETVGYSRYNDIVSSGMLGLAKAYKKYNENNGCTFASYAYATIAGTILVENRDVNNDFVVRMPRWYRKVIELKEKGYTVYDIAEKLHKSISQVAVVSENTSGRFSLDAKVPSLKNNSGETFKDTIISDYNVENQVVNKVTFQELFSILTDREKSVFTLRFEYEKTQVQIGEMLGIGQVQVSRIIRKIQRKAREYFGYSQN